MNDIVVIMELQYLIYHRMEQDKVVEVLPNNNFFADILKKYFGRNLRSYSILRGWRAVTITVTTVSSASIIEINIDLPTDMLSAEIITSNLKNKIFALRLASLGSDILPNDILNYTLGCSVSFSHISPIAYRLQYDVDTGIVTISSPEDDRCEWQVLITLDNTSEQQFYWMYEVLCRTYPELQLKNVNWITDAGISKPAVYANNSWLAEFYKLVPMLSGATSDNKREYVTNWFRTYMTRIMNTPVVVDNETSVESAVPVDNPVINRWFAKTQHDMSPRLPIGGYPNVEDGTIPRRCFIPLRTIEEHAIYDVMNLVEQVGAAPQLTDCICHLTNAANALADWIDHVPRKES